MQSCVIMPEDTPLANIEETRIAGAEVILVPGLISDAARLVAEKARQEDGSMCRLSKSPIARRVRKAMGYELAEYLGCGRPM